MPLTPQQQRQLDAWNANRLAWAVFQRGARTAALRLAKEPLPADLTEAPHVSPQAILRKAAAVIEENGFCRHYLWDTTQAAAGVPPESCRVDIIGALATAIRGSPRWAASAQVRAVEEILAARIPAPSLTAWCSYPGVGRREALRLLSEAADALATA
jgi:hypothetical protein